MIRESQFAVDSVPAWFDNKGPQGDSIISTRVRLARNIAKHQFPYRASNLERTRVFNEVADIFKHSMHFRSFDIINFAQLAKIEQQFLVEERVASPDLLNRDGDRGVICDGSRRVTVMVNEEDHLRIQAIDSGFRPQEIWSVIDMLDDNLGQKLPFSYDTRMGFLTSCPTNSGTGMRISFLMHLPGLVLTKAIDAVLMGASQTGISTRGFFVEHSEVVGNFFQLSNQATMGAHENDFLENTQKVIAEIAGFEQKAREKICRDAKLEITDKIHRSYGILLHAKTLSVAEFMNLSSSLRFGIQCGLFDALTIEALNRITMLIMPAHIQLFEKKELSDIDIGVKRADRVRELLLNKKMTRQKENGRQKRSSTGRIK
jgi:protein arginine kinase